MCSVPCTWTKFVCLERAEPLQGDYWLTELTSVYSSRGTSGYAGVLLSMLSSMGGDQSCSRLLIHQQSWLTSGQLVAERHLTGDLWCSEVVLVVLELRLDVGHLSHERSSWVDAGDG